MKIIDQATNKIFIYNHFATITDIFGDVLLCPALASNEGISYLHPSRLSKKDHNQLLINYRKYLRLNK